MKPLILIGGGGHCKAVIDAAESAGFVIKGILDRSEKIGTEVLGYPVIGTDESIFKYIDDCEFVVTLGFIKDPLPRISLHHKITEAGGKFATVIASTAQVSRYSDIGIGTVVLHGACINAAAKIGKGAIINTMANIEHDAEVGDYCHISTGTMINGGCYISNGTFVGSHSVINQNVKIGENVIIASGSVVRKNIYEPGIYGGNPVKLIQ